MKISITLPTLDQSLLATTLDNIDESSTRHEIEVLVCSPFPPWLEKWPLSERLSVRWVQDHSRSGCVAAHKAAALQATGDLITAFADDHSYVEGWDAVAVENFLRREARDPQRMLSLGLRQVTETPHVGTMFGTYYPYFPLMRLGDVHAIGGWYDAEKYKNGFSDPDLGMRVWRIGGLCEWADKQTIRPRPEDSARRGAPDYLGDAKVFLATWARDYGAGWAVDYVREWDIDVPVGRFPADSRTCYRDESIKMLARMADG